MVAHKGCLKWTLGDRRYLPGGKGWAEKQQMQRPGGGKKVAHSGLSCMGRGYNEAWARESGKSQMVEGCECHGKELEFILGR